MISWELFALIPGLILFLYGIENFSNEIQKVVGDRFRSLLGKLTNTRIKGAILGAVVTAIAQSSTATTVITVGLVNAGVISFSQSLGVIIGTNVGTTMTAQLVAFRLTAIAPLFILLGFLISLFGKKYRFLGKPIFYFGLVFFSLNIMSDAIEPFKEDPDIAFLFASFTNVAIALLAGFLFTLIVQSSSVTTGIVVVLAQGGFISPIQGIPILLGANIGTTATSLLASSRMSLHAKRASVAHFLFNFIGVLLILPFLADFEELIYMIGGGPAQQVANAHLVFNIIMAIVFLIFIGQFKKAVELVVPGTEDEILFKTKYLNNKLPEDNKEAFGVIEKELGHLFDVSTTLFKESMSCINDNNDGKTQRVAKLGGLTDFLNKEIEQAILDLSKRKLNANEARKTILLVRISNTLEHLSDIAVDLSELSRNMMDTGLSLTPEGVSGLRSIYGKFNENMIVLRESFPMIKNEDIDKMRDNDVELRELTNLDYGDYINRYLVRKVSSGSMFIEMVSVIESANYRLREIRKLLQEYRTL
ncbi:Na/Pi cotransporter family protein [Methanocella sp. CWC-04]|uniref:Na/Pi cotransporter family protein n=1 Tax=Methanooceanicella nereidis TaxID=2052831 RepID=A0AAP2W844_9EURY|nr:Na/Pi cotransporter family protein [Methanocella sp. CWC-04]MCD1295706.1 Na/Pi cotransporter family protein [Methanocella sp. CWC-04]